MATARNTWECAADYGGRKPCAVGFLSSNLLDEGVFSGVSSEARRALGITTKAVVVMLGPSMCHHTLLPWVAGQSSTDIDSNSLLDTVLSSDFSADVHRAVDDASKADVAMLGPSTCLTNSADIDSSSLLEAGVSSDIPGGPLESVEMRQRLLW